MARPSKYKAEFAKQAEKLAILGATDQEIADFFEGGPSEDDWLAECLRIIRMDRRGKHARLRETRSRQRAKANTPTKRLRNAVSARMWAALSGRTDGALFGRLGYSLADLQAHLERQFAPGMSWGNYGAWHVDHRRPCASFDLSDPEQFRQCWSLDNLQPLWAADNIKKGARYACA